MKSSFILQFSKQLLRKSIDTEIWMAHICPLSNAWNFSFNSIFQFQFLKKTLNIYSINATITQETSSF